MRFLILSLILAVRVTSLSQPNMNGSAPADIRQSSIRMETTVSSSSSPSLLARRSLFGRVMVAAVAMVTTITPTSPARADYGQAANQAMPGLVPSPLKPTGEMAKTCNVVAAGREDVCLEPKKLPSAYDKVLIGRALEELDNPADDPIQAKLSVLLNSIAEADWEACGKELSKANVDSGGVLPNKAAVTALQKACKKGDGPDAAKAVVKIAGSI